MALRLVRRLVLHTACCQAVLLLGRVSVVQASYMLMHLSLKLKTA